MGSNNKTARLAGPVYLAIVVTGVFSLLYVPSRLGVPGNVVATIDNMAKSESLFRLGLLAEILQYTLFLLLPLVLYRLLSTVDKTAAVLMVAFAAASVPIEFVAVAYKFDILSLLGGGDARLLLSPDEPHARVAFLLDAYDNRISVAMVFWGLWLLPFGYLVYRSHFLPRILGVLLMTGCFSYLVTFSAQLLLPEYRLPDFVMWPVMAAEIGTCLWLLLFGTRTRERTRARA